ncbi:MAG TPA: carbonic anhydrase [Nocardioidaceae bacterium]|nr:carbonic anhydrase [Nocardioidaceae bacterium]
MASEFDDLLDANAEYAASFPMAGFDGMAHAGVAMLTCMDSRIDPLRLIGLAPGDAKIIRNPGGQMTDSTLEGLLLGVHLLGVDRILIVAHTRCAMATNSADDIRRRVADASGASTADISDIPWHVVPDQTQRLRDDVATLRSHHLIPDTVAIGGFLYDVDTGRLAQLV